MHRPLCRMILFLSMAAVAPLSAQSVTPVTSNDSLRVAADTVQATPVAATPTVSKSAVAGASLVGLRAGVHASETNRPSQPTFQAPHANLGQARAMMVVGVAALVAGAIIGGTPGTIIMVGGAVVGLLGLYDYVQ
jgi:hypothetical protein